ncbi:MAG TPA: hypothetical protein VGF70_01845 [Solirubrobacteraceae bacterium]
MGADASAAVPAGLPELAAVHWRRRVDRTALARSGRLWTLCTAAHTAPLITTAGVLAALNPVTIPVGLILLGHAWAIPELYAARGAKVIRRRDVPDMEAEAVALGFLGDLVDHRARDLLCRSGMVLEQASLGVWLLACDGALLVPAGGRRVHCYCVGVSDRGLPPSDRTAHLLLALREDEAGLATVANLAFAGAPWRLRRRLRGPARAALDEAVGLARRLTAHGQPSP